jgi:hypothetical protein
LGHEAAKAFCELEVVRALHSEIKQGARLIIESYKNQSRRRDTIINDIGRSCVISKSSRSTQLSHILQGAEAQILSSVRQRWGSSLLLLMHDGFVSKNHLSTYKTAIWWRQRELYLEVNLFINVGLMSLKTCFCYILCYLN